MAWKTKECSWRYFSSTGASILGKKGREFRGIVTWEWVLVQILFKVLSKAWDQDCKAFLYKDLAMFFSFWISRSALAMIWCWENLGSKWAYGL